MLRQIHDRHREAGVAAEHEQHNRDEEARHLLVVLLRPPFLLHVGDDDGNLVNREGAILVLVVLVHELGRGLFP